MTIARPSSCAATSADQPAPILIVSVFPNSAHAVAQIVEIGPAREVALPVAEIAAPRRERSARLLVREHVGAGAHRAVRPPVIGARARALRAVRLARILRGILRPGCSPGTRRRCRADADVSTSRRRRAARRGDDPAGSRAGSPARAAGCSSSQPPERGARRSGSRRRPDRDPIATGPVAGGEVAAGSTGGADMPRVVVLPTRAPAIDRRDRRSATRRRSAASRTRAGT